MITILLVDAGATPCGIGGAMTRFHFDEAADKGGSDHPDKSVRLLLDLCRQLECGDVNVVLVDYREIPDAMSLDDLARRVSDAHGLVDAICHPYSAPLVDDAHHRRWRSAAYLSPFGRPGPEVLEIASIGHDGPGLGRIPGLYAGIVAVGMAGSDGKPLAASGSIGSHKPDVLAPAVFAVPRDNVTVQYRGSSAGVCFIAAVAAKALSVCGLPDRTDRAAFARLALQVLADEGMLVAPDTAELRKRLRQLAATTQLERATLAAGERWEFHPQGFWQNARIAAMPQVADVLPRYAVRFQVVGESGQREFADRCTLVAAQLRNAEPIAVVAEDAGHYAVLIDYEAGLSTNAPVVRTARRRPFTIVGISASHDASACVLQDGQLRRAVQLERLTRVKHDGVPFLHDASAAKYCLESLGLRESDVDCFAFNAQSLVPGYFGLSQPSHSSAFNLFDPFGKRAVYVSHHLAHAFSGYCLSGYECALGVVADGSGGTVVDADDLLCDGEALQRYLAKPALQRPGLHVMSFYEFSPAGFRLIDRDTAPSFNVRCGSSSLGEAYAAAATYVFGSFHASGKVMGLAPYGDARRLPSALVRDVRGRLVMSSEWKNSYRDVSQRADKWKELTDLCARVQEDFEEALLGRISSMARSADLDMVYSGGLALNCAANARLAAAAPKRFFVSSAAADCGISVGAAYAADFFVNGKVRSHASEHDYLGHPYGPADILAARSTASGWSQWLNLDLEALARELASGWVVGWYDSSPEFGPRALGHRSVLADPRPKRSWDRINREVKYREDFRPFAPIVCADVAAVFFEVTDDLPFMTQTCRVRAEHRSQLQAVCHLDGTARVQTLHRRQNPVLYDLLRRFERVSGYPILLNTSLNVQGQPIVETPGDALKGSP